MTVRSRTSLDQRLCQHAVEYVTGKFPVEAMAWQLRESGYVLDADLLLLGRSGAGPYVLSDEAFKGRKVWIATMPPIRASCGDVWYDTRELMPTVLVPQLKVFGGRVSRSTGRPSGWLSLYPARAWQLMAFERSARMRWIKPFEAAIKFRNRRWEAIEHERYAGGLIHAEGRAYAAWLSKSLQSAWSQNALYLMLAVELHDKLVGRGEGHWEEWTDDRYDEGRVGVVGNHSYMGILPASIVEPDSFGPRRLVRTFFCVKRASQLRRGIRLPSRETDFALKRVLKR